MVASKIIFLLERLFITFATYLGLTPHHQLSCELYILRTIKPIRQCHSQTYPSQESACLVRLAFIRNIAIFTDPPSSSHRVCAQLCQRIFN
jgi:hypothetical protein